MGGMDAPTVATGFAALDAELPGGGWPTHSLSELLLAQAGQCEWRLLGPALPAVVQGGGRIYLIAPPKQPHAGGLAQLGLPAAQVVWIDATAPADRLWATEQIVKSDPAGAILAWLPQARAEQLRRLQVHAQGCSAPVFLFRPALALRDASPAPLRVSVHLEAGWSLGLRIPKRRGVPLDEVLHLAAMPANLGSAVPPRLVSIPAPAGARLSQVVPDARTLGRAAPHSFARLPIAH
ncbi:MAG: translesion DNA synthesis-associated protein ImuA [Giesbergeria sp.]|jgi:protein ImuA|nr:translesion DNA synthesis-associated protein ImuA [Giesbergeria sp.]MBP6160153.1 translesion DNA synthesis-associated protein ImuA [Giesbergeria sp.]MBP7084174.1 translesion DNA synthesis-associated protein ImuA [Giesbergeria sp.]MBP9785826.1 translesion DNA synthesis-associated protein ImuA [Giesbergeria sp.]MBP9894255.1 translesion DNA synthesis-associated protein ImuA [Giesbergeria sp.]